LRVFRDSSANTIYTRESTCSDRDIVAEYKLDHDFLAEIYALPGGHEIKKCIQWGRAAAAARSATSWITGPESLFSLIRAGFRDEVLRSNTIWICSSCYTCAVRCPKGHQDHGRHVRPQAPRRQGGESEGQKAVVLSRNFARMVNTYGRNHETELMTRYIIEAEPHHAFNFVPQGWRLFSNRRLPLMPHRIKNIQQLKRILKKVDELGEI